MSYKIDNPEDMIVHKAGRVTHPGSMIRNEIAEKGLTVKDAAAQIGISESRLDAVLGGEAPANADIAERLGTIFGGDFTQLVHRWQQDYDQSNR